MSSELDNLVVAHLREVYAELQGITAKLEEHSRRFGLLERHLEGFRPVIEHTLSLATLNQLKVGNWKSIERLPRRGMPALASGSMGWSAA